MIAFLAARDCTTTGTKSCDVRKIVSSIPPASRRYARAGGIPLVWYAVAAILALCCLVAPGRSGLAADEPGRFEVVKARLADAAPRVAKLLGVKVVIALEERHPARGLTATLSMPVTEPNDLLNAVAAAYGLRWVRAVEKEIRFVSKREYRGSAAGLRNAVADALPTELQNPVCTGGPDGIRAVEGILKTLGPEDLRRFETASANGPVRLDSLDPGLAQPLVRYLNAFSAFRLGNACDTTAQELHTVTSVPAHYGVNAAGSRQFSFRIGNGWLAVGPE